MPRRVRTLCFWFAMAALLTPGFAVAFTYFDFALKRGAPGRECLFCLVTALRYSPLALLVVWLMPPALSNEALHCLRLQPSLSWWRR